MERDIKDLFNELRSGDDFIVKLNEFIGAGNNSVLQSRVAETMIVDDSWIYTIENLIYSVEQIVKNPKKFIIDDRIIVNVEKAKKTDAETIRHLASHTNYIRAVENGKILPSKLLTKEMDEDLLIYENRFVYSLIMRLTSFIEQRYTAIKDQIDTYDTVGLKLRSKFKMGKNEVDYDLNIKVRNEPTDKVMLIKNRELLQKIEAIRKRLQIMKGSDFCRALLEAKPVVPPIMKTNIINMHTDYKNCYRLWMFISSYNTVGYSVDISDKRLPVDSDYFDDLAMIVALSLKTMVDNNAIREPAYNKIPFRKRRSKKYRELRKIDYTPTFRGVAGIDDKDAVNQYYFDKIREIVENKENLKSNDIVNTVTIDRTFQNIFRNLNNLNNELYKELLSISKYPEPVKVQTPFQKKRLAFNRQEELLKKYQLLSRLKAAELEKTLLKENTQKLKYERLKFEYEKALEKEEGKKAVKRKKKVIKKVAEHKKKLSDIYARAERDESLRLEKERERQQKILERDRIRLENLAKAREEQRKIREIAKEILSRKGDKWED